VEATEHHEEKDTKGGLNAYNNDCFYSVSTAESKRKDLKSWGATVLTDLSQSLLFQRIMTIEEKPRN
jgi:hypothetical protein